MKKKKTLGDMMPNKESNFMVMYTKLNNHITLIGRCVQTLLAVNYNAAVTSVMKDMVVPKRNRNEDAFAETMREWQKSLCEKEIYIYDTLHMDMIKEYSDNELFAELCLVNNFIVDGIATVKHKLLKLFVAGDMYVSDKYVTMPHFENIFPEYNLEYVGGASAGSPLLVALYTIRTKLNNTLVDITHNVELNHALKACKSIGKKMTYDNKAGEYTFALDKHIQEYRAAVFATVVAINKLMYMLTELNSRPRNRSTDIYAFAELTFNTPLISKENFTINTIIDHYIGAFKEAIHTVTSSVIQCDLGFIKKNKDEVKLYEFFGYDSLDEFNVALVDEVCYLDDSLITSDLIATAQISVTNVTNVFTNPDKESHLSIDNIKAKGDRFIDSLNPELYFIQDKVIPLLSRVLYKKFPFDSMFAPKYPKADEKRLSDIVWVLDIIHAITVKDDMSIIPGMIDNVYNQFLNSNIFKGTFTDMVYTLLRDNYTSKYHHVCGLNRVETGYRHRCDSKNVDFLLDAIMDRRNAPNIVYRDLLMHRDASDSAYHYLYSTFDITGKPKKDLKQSMKTEPTRAPLPPLLPIDES